MSSAKLIVAYPQPVDIDAFEKLYAEEHVALAVAKLVGKTKIVATKIIASPQGKPQFYRGRRSIFLPLRFSRSARLQRGARKPWRMR